MRTATEGIEGEAATARYLIRRGWTIVARRWRGGGGEIDLVARRGRMLVFVEVKTRARPDTGDQPVSLGQQRRLRRAVETYLATRCPPGVTEVRQDVALVGPARPWRTVRYLAGALDGDIAQAPRSVGETRRSKRHPMQ
jgi:putative endonuclease